MGRESWCLLYAGFFPTAGKFTYNLVDSTSFKKKLYLKKKLVWKFKTKLEKGHFFFRPLKKKCDFFIIKTKQKKLTSHFKYFSNQICCTIFSEWVCKYFLNWFYYKKPVLRNLKNTKYLYKGVLIFFFLSACSNI